MADRDRTVSRRSNPAHVPLNWRTAKPLGPAPAPGCDEPTSRCQTPPSIWTLRVSACYPQYLLSVERWPFHSEPPDHYDRFDSVDLSVSQSGRLMPLHSTNDFDRSEPTFARLRYFLGGDRPSQTTHHTMSCCRITAQLDVKNNKRGISLVTPLS